MRLKGVPLLTLLVFLPVRAWAGPTRHHALPWRSTTSYSSAPYATPVLVITPYAPAYIFSPTVVVTAPYFCILHNEGFVSRIGLIDHLAGTHKIALDAASTLCPGGATHCTFPSY